MGKKWDLYLTPTHHNGLKKESLVRLAKITTLEKSLILGRLGSLSKENLTLLDNNLKILFDL